MTQEPSGVVISDVLLVTVLEQHFGLLVTQALRRMCLPHSAFMLLSKDAGDTNGCNQLRPIPRPRFSWSLYSRPQAPMCKELICGCKFPPIFLPFPSPSLFPSKAVSLKVAAAGAESAVRYGSRSLQV